MMRLGTNYTTEERRHVGGEAKGGKRMGSEALPQTILLTKLEMWRLHSDLVGEHASKESDATEKEACQRVEGFISHLREFRNGSNSMPVIHQMVNVAVRHFFHVEDLKLSPSSKPRLPTSLHGLCRFCRKAFAHAHYLLQDNDQDLPRENSDQQSSRPLRCLPL